MLSQRNVMNVLQGFNTKGDCPATGHEVDNKTPHFFIPFVFPRYFYFALLLHSSLFVILHI